MKRTCTTLLVILILCGCFREDKTIPATIPAGDAEDPLTHPPTLLLADYPTSDTPYRVESGDFWLVHTPQGHLFSFVPISPEYDDRVSVDECRFTWTEANSRFTDPCSGDEWELDGQLNLKHSTELWSNRDLDQYAITVEDGVITVHLDTKIPGTIRVESPSS